MKSASRRLWEQGLMVCLLAMAMATTTSSASGATGTHKAMTDRAITLAVTGDMNIDEGVLPNSVGVSTSHGIVTLSGSVADLLAKKRAVEIAESIRGVRAVVDRITVAPVSRPDEDIRRDVAAALHEDPATESYQIAVAVKDAVVTLGGSVGSWTESQLAQWVAEGITGVKEVRNDIQINYLAKRTDQEIAADIKERLQWDIWVNGDLIDVAVKSGHVVLGGAVGSAAERRRAFNDAWVNGVTSVEVGGLTVDSWARDQGRRRYKFVVKSDDEIRRAVQASFGRDPRLSPFPPQVTVEDGLVSLSGTVGNLRAKTAAEQDARDTVGVSWVDDFVNVLPKDQPPDAVTEKNLKAALRWNPQLAGCQIEVAVINHVAYLGGWVGSALQRAEAQDAAERTKGVVEVRNHLKIWAESRYTLRYPHWRDYAWEKMWPPSPKSDGQIKKDIEKAFSWSPFIDRDHITVTVQDGVATLTGTVDGWLGYREAGEEARKSGATAVRNHLLVKQGTWT